MTFGTNEGMALIGPTKTHPITTVEFDGRIVMIGCGSIGQTVLPVLDRHVPSVRGRLLVLAADELGRRLAEQHGAQFLHCHLTPGNHGALLARHVKAGDLVLNLSVDVSSRDLIRLCAERDALYVDTSIEPWPGVLDNPMLELRERTNYVARQQILRLARELGPDSPTAVVDHGANPGLVSHFVKSALLNLDRAIRGGSAKPTTREEFARLACDLGVACIQISERDTQASDRPKRHGEFINTWSIDGFVDELMQPVEFSFGTAERRSPRSSREHDPGSGTRYRSVPGRAPSPGAGYPPSAGSRGCS